jgi:hypothetical protein
MPGRRTPALEIVKCKVNFWQDHTEEHICCQGVSFRVAARAMVAVVLCNGCIPWVLDSSRPCKHVADGSLPWEAI